MADTASIWPAPDIPPARTSSRSTSPKEQVLSARSAKRANLLKRNRATARCSTPAIAIRNANLHFGICRWNHPALHAGSRCWCQRCTNGPESSLNARKRGAIIRQTSSAPSITIIGGGLAGCEAAWQAAAHGVRVELYEMKPEKFSPAHHLPGLAE